MRKQPPSDAAPARSPAGPLHLAAILAMLSVTGCILVPSEPAEPAAAATASDSDARTSPGTDTRTIPQCTRVLSAASADSIWDCPDPRPPAPVRGPG